MATVVQLCNMALTHIGRAPINATTEASPEAREVTRHYDLARDTLLQSHDWRFATYRMILARLATDRMFNTVDDPDTYQAPESEEVRQVQGLWLYAHQLPTGYMRLIQLNDRDMTHKYGAPYQILGETIYSNVEEAFATVLFKVTDTEKYPALFLDALVYGLAARIAYPLTREAKIRNDMIALYDRARGEAMVWDMNLSENIVDHVSEFIDARESGWRTY